MSDEVLKAMLDDDIVIDIKKRGYRKWEVSLSHGYVNITNVAATKKKAKNIAVQMIDSYIEQMLNLQNGVH